jgi:hypothetical protein
MFRRDELEAMLRGDAELMRVLALLRSLDLPQGWLVAGAIYQTVWNRLCGLPPGTGIRDYDLIYFDDADLSYEAEDAVIRKVTAEATGLRAPVEARNQARVHLWYEQRFDAGYPRLASADEALGRYTHMAFAVGARLGPNGRMDIMAPFGLDDMFAMVLRRNPACPAPLAHVEKAARAKAMWPALSVVD